MINQSPIPVSLLHASLQPDLEDRFFVYDDHGLSGLGLVQPFELDLRCLVLAPGQRYAFTVLYKVPASAATATGSTGFFQSLLTIVSWEPQTLSNLHRPRFVPSVQWVLFGAFASSGTHYYRYFSVSWMDRE